jgi:hypothetical protein
MQFYTFEAAVRPADSYKYGLLFLASVCQYFAGLTNNLVLSYAMTEKLNTRMTGGLIYLLVSTLDLFLGDFAKRFEKCDF